MSAHRHAWKQRAGVVVALVAGALLALPAASAMAIPPDVNAEPNSVTVQAGSDTTVTVQIYPRDPSDTSVTINVTGLPSGVSCTSGCGKVTIKFPDPKQHLLTLKAAGDAPAGDATVTVQAVADGGSGTTRFSLTVKAGAPTPPQSQTVKEISGKVVDAATGAGVPNAIVGLLDSQQHSYTTTTSSSGSFRFTGSAQNPIAPGQVELGARKDDIQKTKTVTAGPGQSLTGQRIALQLKAETTATPTIAPTEDAVPVDEQSVDATEEATAGEPKAADEESGGFGSWLLIIVGGLFVAVGVGTIVLLWMRRRDDGGGGHNSGAGTGGHGSPPSRGGYRGADDQTRMVNRAGAGPDPTRVVGPSLADAPTMLHNRPVVDDEFPDPYGAPLPPAQPQPSQQSPYGGAGQGGWAGSGYGEPAPTQPGYGGYGNAPSSGGGYGNTPSSGGGYGNAPSSGGGYGNAPSSGSGYGNAPSSGGGYGNAPSSGGGYGNRDYGAPAAPGGSGGSGYPPASGGYGERYDEPTGRYEGRTEQYAPPTDPYKTAGAYAPSADTGRGYGYEQQQYGRGQEPTGGYGQGGGYDSASSTGGYDSSSSYSGGDRYDQRGYGAPSTGGYEQPTTGGGYDQRGGYESQGGYDRIPEQRGGHDNRGYEQGGYYGSGGSTQREPAPPQQDRAGRRSLDWLDD